MSPLPGRRAGMAILRVELEEITPDRVLIHVETVDDVVEHDTPDERAFRSCSDAIEYLGTWIERWAAER